MLEDLIISGAMTGAVYALLALGFTLIYGVAKILNLSHGAFYMLGAYVLYFFGPLELGLEPLPALILDVILVGLTGAIIYILFIRPVIESEISVMVITLGVAMIFQFLLTLLSPYGSGNTPLPTLLPGGVYILGVWVMRQKLLALVVSFSLIATLWIFISKSKIGGAMRAMAQDSEAAKLMGINVERLYMLTMALSASLAAIAGALITSATTLVAEPSMWMYPLIISFSVVILGGLGSIKGSLVGAFIIAYAEQSVLFLVAGGEYLRGAVSLAVMVLVLLLRPRGLFGKRVEME